MRIFKLIVECSAIEGATDTGNGRKRSVRPFSWTKPYGFEAKIKTLSEPDRSGLNPAGLGPNGPGIFINILVAVYGLWLG